jgi:hypothetical protein
VKADKSKQHARQVAENNIQQVDADFSSAPLANRDHHKSSGI